MKRILILQFIFLLAGWIPCMSQAKNGKKKQALKVVWTEKSTPELTGTTITCNDAVSGNEHILAEWTSNETWIGRAEEPQLRIRLDISIETTQKIYRDYTELDYVIKAKPIGFSFNKKFEDAYILIMVNSREERIDLGIKTSNPNSLAAISFTTIVAGNGKDVIMHIQSVKDLKALCPGDNNLTALKEKLKSYYPADASTQPVFASSPQFNNTPKPARISFMGSVFGGAGNRMLRVNRTQYDQDKPIKDRNDAETAIGAIGVQWGVGFNFGWKHTLAVEALVLKEGFRSTGEVDWSSGKLLQTHPTYYSMLFNGVGLGYYFLPEKFIFHTGVHYTRLSNASELGKQIRDESWIGKIMIGYSNRMGEVGNYYIAPTLFYNFTPLNKGEITTRPFSYGITFGIRGTEFR